MRMSEPFWRRWVAKLWRKVWGETGLSIPAALAAALERDQKPRRFASAKSAQATALACSLPEVALSRWSLAEIVKRLLVEQVTSAISISTVWRWLSADQLRPWRFHNWQPILDVQKFLERARPVLEQPPVPAKGGQPVHVAPRYKRQGALQLFAGLNVVDGYKYGQTSQRKRFVDFQ